MTPERRAAMALTIMLDAQVGLQAVADRIEQIAAEQERETWRAALTEAAENCCEITGTPPSDMTDDQIATADATARCIKREVIALRDRGPK